MNFQLYNRIKEIAKKEGYSLQQVSEKAGIKSTNIIYSWKYKTPTIDNLTKVAKVLHVSVNDLLTDSADKINDGVNNFHKTAFKYTQARDQGTQVMHTYPIGGNPLQPLTDEDIEKVRKLEPNNYQVRVPILGKIACGEPIFAEQNIIGYKDLTFDHEPVGTLFLLKCQGHSMEPLIPDGSLVTIREQSTVENGELAAVLIDDGATIKRVKFADDEIILMPENRNYDPIILNDKNPGTIIGKVIHVDFDVE